MNVDVAHAGEFVAALTGNAETPCTWQTFDDSPEKRRRLAFVVSGKLSIHARANNTLAVKSRQGAGVFVTVNETDGKGRKASNLVACRAVWLDKDDGKAEPAFALPPSIIVETKRGHHYYWLVDASVSVDDCKPVNLAIAQKYAGDAGSADACHVLRLPGFPHQKDPAAPFLVRMTFADRQRIYCLNQLVMAFGYVEPDKRRQVEIGEHREFTGEVSVRALADLGVAMDELANYHNPTGGDTPLSGLNAAINAKAYHLERLGGAGEIDRLTAHDALFDAVKDNIEAHPRESNTRFEDTFSRAWDAGVAEPAAPFDGISASNEPQNMPEPAISQKNYENDIPPVPARSGSGSLAPLRVLEPELKPLILANAPRKPGSLAPEPREPATSFNFILRDAWPVLTAELERRASEGFAPVSSGIDGLDELLGGGAQRAAITLLCGPPGAGKTSFAVDWGLYHARQGHPVLVWSLEMPAIDIYSRLVTLETGLSWGAVRAGQHNDAVREVGEALGDLHIVVVDREQVQSVDRLEWFFDEIVKKTGLAPLVIVDYAQLVALAARDTDIRGAASRSSYMLLNLARKRSAAVLALSSVGRSAYNVLDKSNRPDIERVLGMAKESGQFEFDAAAVCGISLLPTKVNGSKIGWISVGKSRLGGHTGRVAVEYHGQSGRFKEISEDEIPSSPLDAEDVNQRILAALPGSNATEIARAARVSKKRALMALAELQDDGRVVRQDGVYVRVQ